MTPDVFNSNLFSLTSLTGVLNKIPYQPGQISAMGLYEEAGISTLDVWIEESHGVLKLLEVKPRSSPGTVVELEKRKGRSFRIAHIPVQASVMADEVQGVRVFGSENQSQTVVMKRDEKLALVRRDIDYTIEAHRMLNLAGYFADANGDAISLFTTFDVVEQSLSLDVASDATIMDDKCLTIIEYVEAALGGVPYTGIEVLCGKTLWANFRKQVSVRNIWLNTPMAANIRADATLPISISGITFRRYRGDTVVKMADTEARAFPTGVPGMYLTRFGPANYIETVNTVGIPFYGKSEPMEFGKGVKIEAQSNVLNLITRPRAIIKLTSS